MINVHSSAPVVTLSPCPLPLKDTQCEFPHFCHSNAYTPYLKPQYCFQLIAMHYLQEWVFVYCVVI